MPRTNKDAVAEQRKARSSGPDLVDTLMTISRRCSSLPDVDGRDAAEILGYDESSAFRQRSVNRGRRKVIDQRAERLGIGQPDES